jgi:hypothetical protein
MGDAYREDPVARREMEALKRELDGVTRFLCSLMGALSPSTVNTLPPDMQEWWRRHQEYDRSQGR